MGCSPVPVLSEMKRFKQAQSQGQFFLAFERRCPLGVMLEQFFGLGATLAEELFKHGGRSCTTRRKFGAANDFFRELRKVGSLSEGGFFFPASAAFPFLWQAVGGSPMVAAQERDANLK